MEESLLHGRDNLKVDPITTRTTVSWLFASLRKVQNIPWSANLRHVIENEPSCLELHAVVCGAEGLIRLFLLASCLSLSLRS
jgi:hypothetical protein